MKRRHVIGAVLVVLILPAVLIGRTPMPDEWARTATHPQTLSELRALPREYRAAMRAVLTTDEKSRLWTVQIAEFKANRTFTATQQSILATIDLRTGPEYQRFRHEQAEVLKDIVKATYAGKTVTNDNRDAIEKDLIARMSEIYPGYGASSLCTQVLEAFPDKSDRRALGGLGEPATDAWSVQALALRSRIWFAQHTSASAAGSIRLCRCNGWGFCENCWGPEIFCIGDNCNVQETPECGCPWDEPKTCLKQCDLNPSGTPGLKQ